MSFYPNLPEAVVLQLRVVLQHMKSMPNYIEGSSYSDDVKDFLKELNGRTAATAVVEFDGETDRLDYVEKEIVSVMTDLKTLVDSLGNAEHSEKLQVAKARAGLIEKLVAAREKVWTMKEMAEFQARIMTFLDEVCTKDQVQDLKGRLRGLKSVEAE